MLYSYHNNYPEELPNRIRLSDGSTRTDSTTFSAEDITDAGYVLVDPPPEISQDQKLRWDGAWVVETISPEEIIENQWKIVRDRRDEELRKVEWRVSRYNSEIRQGLSPTDDIVRLDVYMQALRDITKQSDPFNLIWPGSEPSTSICSGITCNTTLDSVINSTIPPTDTEV